MGFAMALAPGQLDAAEAGRAPTAHPLGWIDGAVIVLYFAGMLAIGWYYSCGCRSRALTRSWRDGWDWECGCWERYCS
jgi:hypothetical protein